MLCPNLIIYLNLTHCNFHMERSELPVPTSMERKAVNPITGQSKTDTAAVVISLLASMVKQRKPPYFTYMCHWFIRHIMVYNKGSDVFKEPLFYLFYWYKEHRTMELEGKGMEHRAQTHGPRKMGPKNLGTRVLGPLDHGTWGHGDSKIGLKKLGATVQGA